MFEIEQLQQLDVSLMHITVATEPLASMLQIIAHHM